MKTVAAWYRDWRWIALGTVVLIGLLGSAHFLFEHWRLPSECAATEGLGSVQDIVDGGLKDIDRQARGFEEEVLASMHKKAEETGLGINYAWGLRGRAVHSPRGVDFHKDQEYLLGELMKIAASGPGGPRSTCMNVLRAQEALRLYKESQERQQAMILEAIRKG
jgi:hypothetical protein